MILPFGATCWRYRRDGAPLAPWHPYDSDLRPSPKIAPIIQTSQNWLIGTIGKPPRPAKALLSKILNSPLELPRLALDRDFNSGDLHDAAPRLERCSPSGAIFPVWSDVPRLARVPPSTPWQAWELGTLGDLVGRSYGLTSCSALQNMRAPRQISG